MNQASTLRILYRHAVVVALLASAGALATAGLPAPVAAQGLSLTLRDGHVGVALGIGLDVAALPRLVRVPGLPAYYAPDLDANYFFYDGLYWVFAEDNWYASSWFNGPWELIARERVPVFVLRIPLRYYRMPPGYFYGLPAERPPRWGEFWGHEWEQQHRGWNQWDPRLVPPPAPLPRYQRDFEQDRYPRRMEDQRELHERHYPAVPREGTLFEHLGRRLLEQQGGNRAQPGKPPGEGAPRAHEPAPGESGGRGKPPGGRDTPP